MTGMIWKRKSGWPVAFLPESAYNKQQAIKANSNRYRKITIPNYRIRRLQWSLTKSCSNTEKRIISPKNSLQSSCSYRGQRTTVKTEMNGFTLALTAARRPAEWVNKATNPSKCLAALFLILECFFSHN